MYYIIYNNIMVNNYITYLSGGLSGVIEIFFIYPIEYYKTVKQLGTKISFSDFIIQKKKKESKGYTKDYYLVFLVLYLSEQFFGEL